MPTLYHAPSTAAKGLSAPIRTLGILNEADGVTERVAYSTHEDPTADVMNFCVLAGAVLNEMTGRLVKCRRPSNRPSVLAGDAHALRRAFSCKRSLVRVFAFFDGRDPTLSHT